MPFRPSLLKPAKKQTLFRSYAYSRDADLSNASHAQHHAAGTTKFGLNLSFAVDDRFSGVRVLNYRSTTGKLKPVKVGLSSGWQVRRNDWREAGDITDCHNNGIVGRMTDDCLRNARESLKLFSFVVN